MQLVLLDLTQLYFAVKRAKVVLNYAGLLKSLKTMARPFEETTFLGFTAANPNNERQNNFLDGLQDEGVHVIRYPAGSSPEDFTLEMSVFAARSMTSKIVFVAEDPVLQRTIRWLDSVVPPTIVFFGDQLSPSWSPLILSGEVVFQEIRELGRITE